MTLPQSRNRQPANFPLLLELERQAMPREYLIKWHYKALLASSDFHNFGYALRHWFRVRDRREVIEYIPIKKQWPRLTAFCYRDQVNIHRAFGLNVVPPGMQWVDFGQAGLFDDLA